MAARSTLTVTSGTTITSSWGNAVRDHAVPGTTSDDVSSNGQLAVNTSTSRLITRLGGTNYPIAGAMPRVRIRTTTTFALGAGVAALISWDTEDYDTDSLFSTGVSTDYITATRSGMWLAAYQAYLGSTGAAGEKGAWMVVNGTGYWALSATTTASAYYATGAVPMALAAGDTVGLNVSCSTSGCTAMASTSYLQLIYLGPV